MTQSEILNKLNELIEAAKVGILATVHKEGKPHIRWMTPALISGDQKSIYTVVTPHFEDDIDIKKYPDGEWMIQSKSFEEVINIKGKINFKIDSELVSKVLDSLGDRLTMYWKVDKDKTEFHVLEMSIESVHFFNPMQGIHELVSFNI